MALSTTVDARSTRGKVPVSKPAVNGADLDVTLVEMQVSSSEGQHDQAVLSCISETLEKTDDLVDQPISFYYGVPPRTTIFFGYITTVTDEQESQGSLSFTLSILGVTKVMSEAMPKFWTNTTVTSAMAALVERNLLGVCGHTQPNIWRSLAQVDRSDWEQVNAFATQIGWIVTNRLGVVQFHDPVKLFAECGSYTRLVSGQDKPEDDDRNLIEFQATQESGVIQSNLGAKFGYFTTANEVQVAAQTGTFTTYRFLPQTIRDQVEAQSYIAAADSSLKGWQQHAVARIWGDADIYPGQCVDIMTAKPRYRFVKTDGRWFVRSVVHQADRQQYQTQLLLTRPKNQYYSTLAGYKPFWEYPPTRPRPSLSLESKKWVSSWANRALQVATA